VTGPAPQVPYVYRATIVDVHDGDTVTADVDLGMFVHTVVPVRLLGCNAIELNDPGGDDARVNLVGLLLQQHVILRTVKPDKFGGRWDAHIVIVRNGQPDVDVVAWLIAGGWAAPWDGVGPKPVPRWPRPATT
jgi:endonuclease YncB( thermonuclease family)